MSGFLGFRSKTLLSPSFHAAHSAAFGSKSHPLAEEEQDEVLSIVSMATSNNFWDIQDTLAEQTSPPSVAVSVMSDISSSSTVLEDAISPSYDATGVSHEFFIECGKHGDMLFIPNNQAKAIESRCRHFPLLLATGKGGHIVVPNVSVNNKKQQEEPQKNDSHHDSRILRKKTWSIGTCRHVIELLTEGTTWIENDHRRFAELSTACEEIEVRLCLGSMINYHDILDQESTFRFFDSIRLDEYQFKFHGVVTSWQWMHLLHTGILLLAKSKVLMITVASPSDRTALLPTSAKSTKIVTKISPAIPNQQRNVTNCARISVSIVVTEAK